MALDTTPAVRHRLVTRSDFDGLVCAALLKELGLLDDILFVHPKDMQDGKVEVGPGDITTNLPSATIASLVHFWPRSFRSASTISGCRGTRRPWSSVTPHPRCRDS